jgi:adenylosuccinate lyase
MYRPISPLDGRYSDRLDSLSEYFSEFALMRARVQVELRYLLALDRLRIFPPLSREELARVERRLVQFGAADFERIKQIEEHTRHDVKACERFLAESLALRHPEMIHFGLTSEDITNLAYSLLLQEFVHREQLPSLEALMRELLQLAERWADAPFPARTHGQLASPTTAGKEMAVFLHRLLRVWRRLSEFTFAGKLNGATGNFSALRAACPDVDWWGFAERFVRSLGLEPNLVTTQIEDHDCWAEYFDITRRMNNVVLDLDRDIWLYISYEYLRQRAADGQIGSSTMPHKINPINFENSEGNLELANALLAHLSDKLCRSRMQRDLSDSTVARNIGVALSHAHLAITETLRGLRKVDVDRERCRRELEAHPQLLSEPIQTILRLEGVADAYERLREMTQGKRVTRETLTRNAAALTEDPAVRERLAALRVAEYTGDAEAIARRVIATVRKELDQ